MMYHSRPHEQGFSAVELLITLFIAALFLISGTQIYGYIFANGTEAGQTARASNLAYELLQEYKTTYETEGSCETGTSTPTTPDSHDLSIVSATIVVECPYETHPTVDLRNMAKATVTITYKTGSTTESVKHAAYVS